MTPPKCSLLAFHRKCLTYTLLFSLVPHVTLADIGPLHASAQYDTLYYGRCPNQTFHTSNIVAPIVNWDTYSPSCADGYSYFLGPRCASQLDLMKGPVILSDDGNLLWSTREFGPAYGLRMQWYHGEKVLTFWAGDDVHHAHGEGDYYILNSAYEVVKKFGAAPSPDGTQLRGDFHEFLITRNNTALITAYDERTIDFYPLLPGGEHVEGKTFDSLFQEIDIDTGALLFEWRASDHFNISDTLRYLQGDGLKGRTPFDYLHVNSVDKDDAGNYLVSLRHLSSVLYISGATGEILWTLGGQRNSFLDLTRASNRSSEHSPAVSFGWQHDVKWWTWDPAKGDGVLALFDNTRSQYNPAKYRHQGPVPQPTRAATTNSSSLLRRHYNYKRQADSNPEPDLPPDHAQFSRGLLISLNTSSTPPTASLLSMIHNSPRHGIASAAQGNLQRLWTKPETAASSPAGFLNRDAETAVLLGYGISPAWSLHVVSFADLSYKTHHYRPDIGAGSSPIDTSPDASPENSWVASSASKCTARLGPNYDNVFTKWKFHKVENYRVHKNRWVGRPRTKPAVLVRSESVWVEEKGGMRRERFVKRAQEGTEKMERHEEQDEEEEEEDQGATSKEWVAYFSWNGATEVKAWRVEGRTWEPIPADPEDSHDEEHSPEHGDRAKRHGDSEEPSTPSYTALWRPLHSILPKQGFETRLILPRKFPSLSSTPRRHEDHDDEHSSPHSSHKEDPSASAAAAAMLLRTSTGVEWDAMRVVALDASHEIMETSEIITVPSPADTDVRGTTVGLFVVFMFGFTVVVAMGACGCAGMMGRVLSGGLRLFRWRGGEEEEEMKWMQGASRQRTWIMEERRLLSQEPAGRGGVGETEDGGGGGRGRWAER